MWQLRNDNPYPANIFVLKQLSAFYVCCIYIAPGIAFIMEENAKNPDQNAPIGAFWSGSIVFAI